MEIDVEQICENYRQAYKSVHGENPVINYVSTGDRFFITTKTGSFSQYTKRDVQNLTRCLNRLAR